MDEFLTKEEKLKIQTNYEHFLEHLKPDDLAIKLVAKDVMRLNEKIEMQTRNTDRKKNEWLVDEIFFKATYQQICVIREILEESGGQLLASILPVRESSTGSNNNLKAHFNLSERRGSDPTMQYKHQNVERKRSNLSFGSDTSESNCPLSDTYYTDDTSLYTAAGGLHSNTVPDGLFKTGFKRISNSFRRKKTSKSTPNISAELPKLGRYSVKDGNPSSGKALVVIIANFTGDLEGYLNDVHALKYLHREVLQHKTVFEGRIPGSNKSLTNLTRTELLSVLKDIQGYLSNPMSGNMFDRFFFYILSHGDDEGIMTCQKGSATEIEFEIDPKTDKKIPVRTQMQEIVDLFTHDKVKTLKGFPKVFINQACKGEEILRAAGPGGTQDEVDSKKWQPPAAKVAIGADVMLGESTSDNNLAWVSKKGSLYIQSYVEVVSKYFEHETFYDMLAAVNDELSHKIKKGLNPRDEQIVEIAQMPYIKSKLTKKFYLT